MGFPSFRKLQQERNSILSYDLGIELRAANNWGEDYYDAYDLSYQEQEELKRLGYTLTDCTTARSEQHRFGRWFTRISLNADYSPDKDARLMEEENEFRYRVVA
ncbi:hypothetical protein MUN82_08775 [Hymenobacter aerilatus]|uniref:Uncharacterized protein n=1 Tax=Hymenobacter aerilatus TaxID=2932251 RepID=A0A8T9T4Z5_9BACT|nr:hypothetical protein [Hymenobacter aerilatus]UOR07176.1 hypothetical protein MUN82_08775 [Hymenobacter aerilatus]